MQEGKIERFSLLMQEEKIERFSPRNAGGED
jgi:hypothetical protein